ncbi:MAG TPA: hypothetical protein PKD54_13645 [Pirellulaceae bacterium]|mgnify:CR=1 FL=1|nr:hypothetical protein [Pirellulaceae bacterium]
MLNLPAGRFQRHFFSLPSETDVLLFEQIAQQMLCVWDIHLKTDRKLLPRNRRLLTRLGERLQLARLRRKPSAAKVAERAGFSLNISETDNALDSDVAIEVADFLRQDELDARSIMDRAEQSVARWPSLVRELGIPRGEQGLMNGCFDRIQK